MNRLTIQEVYKACLDNGEGLRDVFKKGQKEKEYDLEDLALIYYKIAGLLELTPEINP